MKKTLTTTLTLFLTSVLSAQVSMVKDIYPGSKGSSPQYLTTHSNKLYFTTSDSTNTYGSSYLYESDGNGATNLMKLGGASSFTTFGTKTLFSDDPAGGTNYEPYITNGTTGGTFLLKELKAGGLGSAPRFLGNIGTTAFILHSLYGVYKTDGTTTGTSLMFVPESFYKTLIFKNKVYYWGTHNSIAGLYSFDATSTAPTLIATHTNSTYDFAIAAGSTHFYYVASDATHGYEAWVSDGTAAGTHILKDVNPGTANGCDNGSSGSYTSMAIINDKLYFNPTNPTIGRELWVSNGTEAGTTLLMETVAGTGSENPQKFLATGGKLFFAARYPGYNSNMVWVSDGTTAGTKIVTDKDGSFIEDGGKFALNNKAFIHGRPRSTQEIGFEPFISDGTSAGTYILADINPNVYDESISLGPTQLPVIIGATIYFIANDIVHGRELWKYTDVGTSGINEIMESASLLLYPNPSISHIQLSGVEKIEKAEVYDLTGSLYLTSDKSSIDVSELAAGIYFIKVSSKNAVTTRKFIKQ